MRDCDVPDKRFAVFIGAGCSVSSGIPDARSLVREIWLPRLRDLRAPDRKDIDEWALEVIPGYDRSRPAAAYGDVIRELFLLPGDRQAEVERICEGKFPGFAYGVLASLLAMEGGRFNILLTTNFDDLGADALYLYTNARPLVIQHAALASYIRPTRTRPLVVKLHGDHRLTPLNLAEETKELELRIQGHVSQLLEDRGLIVIGYGGNDNGILRMLSALPERALPWGVYWLSRREPSKLVSDWLETRGAVWVEVGSFDEVMLLLQDAFDMAHPQETRFNAIFKRYRETYERLASAILKSSDSKPGGASLKAAVRRTDQAFEGWMSAWFAAKRLEDHDLLAADAAYREAADKFPTASGIFESYAIFLADKLKDVSRAEWAFKRALELESGSAHVMTNYSLFLIEQGHIEAAKHLLLQALEIAPEDAAALGAFADLSQQSGDSAAALAYYRRAIENAPDDADILGNFANFLADSEEDATAADEMYRRALTADPDHANNHINYATFLWDGLKDNSRAEQFYLRGIELAPTEARYLVRLGRFVLKERGDRDRALSIFLSAEQMEPDAPEVLRALAWFYHEEAGDLEKAESYYKRLSERKSPEVSDVSRYAAFLDAARNDSEGARKVFEYGMSLDPSNDRLIKDYAVFKRRHGT